MLFLFAMGTSPIASAACASKSISVGDSVSESLSTEDCVTTNGYYYDTYKFTGVSGQQLYIQNLSTAFKVDP